MLMQINIYANLDDTIKYTDECGGFWMIPPDKYNFHIVETYFVDPMMDEHELSHILSHIRSFINSRSMFFKFNVGNPYLYDNAEDKIRKFFFANVVHMLGPEVGFSADHLNKFMGNIKTGSDTYIHVSSEEFPILLDITLIKDTKDTDISIYEAISIVKTLFCSVVDMGNLQKYSEQLALDIRSSATYKEDVWKDLHYQFDVL